MHIVFEFFGPSSEIYMQVFQALIYFQKEINARAGGEGYQMN